VHSWSTFDASVTTPLWDKCEDETHIPKVGSWSPPGLSKTQSSSSRVKTPHIEMLFISIERSWSVDAQNVLACVIWTSTAQVMGKRKGRESNWQFDSRLLKVRNRPLPDVCWKSATQRWKALEESYNFGSYLIPIRGWSQEIWAPKVLGFQLGTVSGLLLGSPGKKNHLNVASIESCREYYMGEGGGFPRVRAVVSQVNPSCPWLVPTPKRCRMNSNQLVGWIWMQDR